MKNMFFNEIRTTTVSPDDVYWSAFVPCGDIIHLNYETVLQKTSNILITSLIRSPMQHQLLMHHSLHKNIVISV